MGCDKSTGKEVGCGENEDVEMNVWNHKAGENEEEGSKGAHKVEELSNKLIKGHIKWKNYPIN